MHLYLLSIQSLLSALLCVIRLLSSKHSHTKIWPIFLWISTSRHISTRFPFSLGAVMEATIMASCCLQDIITVIDDSLIQQACHSNQAQRLQGLQGSRPKSWLPWQRGCNKWYERERGLYIYICVCVCNWGVFERYRSWLSMIKRNTMYLVQTRFVSGVNWLLLWLRKEYHQFHPSSFEQLSSTDWWCVCLFFHISTCDTSVDCSVTGFHTCSEYSLFLGDSSCNVCHFDTTDIISPSIATSPLIEMSEHKQSKKPVLNNQLCRSSTKISGSTWVF